MRYPAFASGVATPSQKTDRCPCSASAVSATGSASAAQSRTRARLPSQSRRPCGRLASSPGGRAKFTPVDREKLCGKTKFFQLCLTTNFAKTDAGTLASPRGGGGTALCAVTERGGSHACGGTNSDRVQRTKQGAVSGAALRFLQAPTTARRKNRLSARGAVERSETERAKSWRAAPERGLSKNPRQKRKMPAFAGIFRFMGEV